MFAPEPNYRRSSSPQPHRTTPTQALPEGSHPQPSGSIQSGLTGAVVAFVLGRIFVPAAYPQILRADEWWWKSIMRLPGSHGEGLLAIPVWLIGMLGLIVVFAAMITLLIAHYVDRFYLFPFIGFLIGRGAGGTGGKILRAPFVAVGGFLAVFALSIFDVFRYPRLSHRLASLGVIVLGISAFVVAGRVVVPWAQRDAVPVSPGQEVIRFLPRATWISERSNDQWRFSLSEVALHKDYLELTLLTQNKSRQVRTLGVNPKSRLVRASDGASLESARRLLSVDGEIPMAPATVSVQPGAVLMTRLRFERPAIPEYSWRLNLSLLNRVERDGVWNGTKCGLEFDLRPSEKAPKH